MTFYGAPPRTVVEGAVQEAPFNSLLLPCREFPTEDYVSGVDVQGQTMVKRYRMLHS